MNTIQKTTDYDQFKLIKGNREIRKAHLADLTLSISQKNMLEQNPILVNEDMAVIDGQHRLEVARNNNLPIYYIVIPSASISEVMQLNAYNKAWNAQDYLTSYVNRGHKDYQVLADFMEEYTLSISQALLMIFSVESQWTFKTIMHGKLSLTEEQMAIARERADILFEIRPYLFRKGSHGVPKGFVRALIQIYDDGNGKKLVDAVKKKGLKIEPTSTFKEAKAQLMSVL